MREALSRLISERALEEQANRSVRVPVVNQRRLDDLLQARDVPPRSRVETLQAADVLVERMLRRAQHVELGEGLAQRLAFLVLNRLQFLTIRQYLSVVFAARGARLLVLAAWP